jgi:Carboxylesterase family
MLYRNSILYMYFLSVGQVKSQNIFYNECTLMSIVNRPAVYYGRELGAAIGCTESSSLADCLTAAPLETIYQHADMFSSCAIRGDMGLHKPNPWVPTVDSWADQPFVPKDPEQLLQEGQVKLTWADRPFLPKYLNSCFWRDR